jgi:lactate dehydrogenase-like 2-hydroxyacid dehydrogenase
MDSISSAVAKADYISLNIPYIKGEGGTHGIIGKQVLGDMKSDAVLLNFARGELVDSEAMKEFLDRGNGRYISDFPDDLLWNHKNAILLPHLGASTEEAEETAVSEVCMILHSWKTILIDPILLFNTSRLQWLLIRSKTILNMEPFETVSTFQLLLYLSVKKVQSASPW